MADDSDHDALSEAFWTLTEEQIALLHPHGQVVTTEAGQTLFQQGDPTCDFYVVLDGTVELVEPTVGTPRSLGLRQLREIVGELNLLNEEATYLTAVVQQSGSVLAISAEDLRTLIRHDPAFSDILLRAFLLLRSHLIGIGAGLKIIGSRYDVDNRRLLEFASRNRLPHDWLDVETDVVAEGLLQQFGLLPTDTPVVIWKGIDILRNPTNAELGQLLGLGDELVPDEPCDLVVIGAGPAGLAAAVYGASEGLQTVVLEAVATGGQAGMASRIENYLGFPAGLSGIELASRAMIQATKFGARISLSREVVGLRRAAGTYLLTLADGGEVGPTTGSWRCRVRPSWSAAASTTPPPKSKPWCAKARTSPSWVGATRRARRPSSSPSGHARFSCWCGASVWTRACPATWSTGLSRRRPLRCSPAPRFANCRGRARSTASSWSAPGLASGAGFPSRRCSFLLAPMRR